jgi:hypothetical protein
MKNRRNRALLISSALFTLSLLYLAPAGWECAKAGWHTEGAHTVEDAGWQAAAQLYGQLGIAGLTIIAVGIVVAWTAFFHGLRCGWFVMFIIVWGWAFPMLVLPLLTHRISMTMSQWLSAAWQEPGQPRVWVENVAVFSMMLVSLILPVKTFLRTAEPII